MNTIVDIQGTPHELARLDRAAIEALCDSGALDRLGNVELIDGVLVRMSPARAEHGRVIFSIAGHLLPTIPKDLIGGTDIGVFFGDGTMRSPDIVVFDKAADEGFLDAEYVKFIIEVSHSTLQIDLSDKAREYAAFGIAEYWVVDVENRRLHVHRDPGKDGYASIFVVTGTEAVNPLCAPDLSLALSDILT